MMCLHKFVRRGCVPMLLLPVLIGCVSIGPAVVPRDPTDYRSSMANLMANLINSVTMALATLGRLCRRLSA